MEDQSDSPDRPVPPPWRPDWRDVLGAVALIALFGAVSGMHVLGLLTGHAEFLTTRWIEQLVPGLAWPNCPVPTAVAGMQEFLDRLAMIGRWPVLRLATLAVAMAAAAAQVRLMNPALFGPADAVRRPHWRTGVAAGLSVAVLVMALWPLPPALAGSQLPLARAALAGGLVWLLWHRRGWLHDVTEPPTRWQVLAQLPCGAVVGLAAHSLLRHQITGRDVAVLSNWLEAGQFAPIAWREIAVHSIAGRAWGGLAVGTLAVLCGLTGVRWRSRLALVAGPLLLTLLASGGLVLRQRQWVNSYGYGRPLARYLVASKSQPPPGPVRAVVLLTDAEGPLPGWVTFGHSVANLPLTAEFDQRCVALLARTGGVTCQAREALIHLHDGATARWDPAAVLAVERTQISSPATSPLFVAAHLELLGKCSWSEEGERAVADLLTPERFVLPWPQAVESVALTAWRWSRLPRLAPLLRERNRDLLARLEGRTPPRHDGRLSGRLTWQGKPWPNVRVGLLSAADAAGWASYTGPLTPWLQRQVAASVTTAADGSFAFQHVFDGQYRLVVSLPVELAPGPGPWEARGVPRTIDVRGGRRPQRLGTIEVRLYQPHRGVVPVGVNDAAPGKNLTGWWRKVAAHG